MKKFWKHKSKFAAIALVLLMASVALTLYTPVQAQDEYENQYINKGSEPLPPGVTADLTLETKSYLSFRPNPVGVGQTFLVNFWIHPPIHITRKLTDFTVTITDPDGNEDVIKMDSYPGDGTGWLEWIADQVGTWTLKFDFPGGYYPPGNYTLRRIGYADSTTEFDQSVYYKPSSDGPYNLVVQEEPVLSWPPSPLPTDYWTRPVPLEHREWWPILGNYPWRGLGGGELWDELYPNTNKYGNPDYNFVPWVQAPNTAHVVWKRQESIKGIIGGDLGVMSHYDASGFYPNVPDIIYEGRGYQAFERLVDEESVWMWQSFDIRTGEIFWERPLPTTLSWNMFFGWQETPVKPTYITYTRRTLQAVPGEEAHLRGQSVDLLYVGLGKYVTYDPYTGLITMNQSIAPLNSGTLYMDPYLLTVQNLGFGVPADQRYRLINWTVGRDPDTGVTGMMVMDNITWPWSNLGDSQDFEAGIAVGSYSISHPATGVAIGLGLRAASLKTGAELWDITTDLSSGLETTFSSSSIVADHGKVAVLMNTGELRCWDLFTGAALWTTPPTSHPWGTFGAYHRQSAYGYYYKSGYDGIHAYDWETGKVAWTFQANTSYPYETPFHVDGTGVNVFHGGGLVADGKLYVAATEHTPSMPLTRGWKLYCLNATTGEKMWDFTASPVYYSRSFSGAVADGYLTFSSESDGYMYVFGKGKSATTVEAPLTAIPLGQNVMIKGTVLDLSPAQPGTPCVSKDSMSGWMEYLHLQAPIPAEVTGVPVSLDTIDPNGNFIHIGDVTTDMSGMFSHMWTPEITGKYTVIATFMGDDSYGSSYAETAVGVTEAPEPYPEPPEYGSPEWPEYPEAPTYTSVDLILIAAIVVVAILVVYDIFGRKRQ